MRRGKSKPGDPFFWSADEYNRAAARAEDLLALKAVPPLRLDDRRNLSLDHEPGFWALLTGSASPYSAAEQVRSGGAWVNGPRSTSAAVEVNGVGSLNGKLAYLRPSGTPGEWLFQHVKVGAPCSQVVNVKGCANFALPGAAVAVAGFGSQTTDASGNCTFAGLTNGANYSYTITPPSSRLQTASGNFTANCGTVGLTCATPAAGYACSPVCEIPLATTLHLTDSVYGSFTLTYSAGVGWQSGGATINFPGCGMCAAASGVGVVYFLSLSSTLFQRSVYTTRGCPSGGSGLQNTITFNQTSKSCPPSAFSWSGTNAAYSYTEGYCAQPTVTVTE